jgi:hypothetical protein
MSKTMLVPLIVATAALIAGCAHEAPRCSAFGCPQTPIGDYTGWGKCAPGQCAKPGELKTYRCVQGDTEIIRRGVENPDPQACKPVEHI